MSPPFDLMERYFDGELSSEQERELGEWLGADREHLRIFLREVHLTHGMRVLSPHFETDKEQNWEDACKASRLLSHDWLWARGALVVLAKHWRPMAFGGALGLFLLAAFIWLTHSPCELTVASQGGVFLRRSGSERVVHGSVKLHSGDIIRTESSARALIQYDRETTHLEVGGDTSIEIHQARRIKLLRLNVGTVYATVARQRFGSRLELSTPQAHAQILGTDLKLLSRPDRTELEVYSGQVLLARSRDGKGVSVLAGYSGLVAEGGGVSSQRIPSASGWILWEYWLGIPGATIRHLTEHARFATDADFQGFREIFKTPHLLPGDYGGRVRGYLHAPRTGEYNFWITGDDAAELWLSPDDQPNVKQRICYTAKFTAAEQWEKYPTQKSHPIHLIGGRKYYIEALLKQAAGSDELAVAWQGPGMVREILAGAYLSPVPDQEGNTRPK